MPAILLFVTSLALGFYIVAGYPLLLGLQARLRPKPILKTRQQKSVSVVIAVHNGEQFVAEKLESVLQLDYPPDLIETIVVSDGSTDRTASIVQTLVSDRLRLFELPRGGKCAALNAAISHTNNEILLLTDVRQRLAPDSLQLLVDCFSDPSVGVASGELKIRAGKDSGEASTGLYWRYESWIRTQLSEIDSMFGATGPLYAMRRELAVPIPADILLDDMYLPLSAFFKGYRLVQEPRAGGARLPHVAKRRIQTESADAWRELPNPAGLSGTSGTTQSHVASFYVV